MRTSFSNRTCHVKNLIKCFWKHHAVRSRESYKYASMDHTDIFRLNTVCIDQPYREMVWPFERTFIPDHHLVAHVAWLWELKPKLQSNVQGLQILKAIEALLPKGVDSVVMEVSAEEHEGTFSGTEHSPGWDFLIKQQLRAFKDCNPPDLAVYRH